MNNFLANLHADLRRARYTLRGATHRAEDVPRGTFKEYPRMPRIPLPAPMELTTPLREAILKRRSARSDTTGDPITLAEMGTLLGLSLGKHSEDERRHYPSGGGLYPIETYLISTALEGQTPAVYHYNPEAHALERLWDLPAEFEAKEIGRLPETFFFSSMLVFTSVWQRSSAKYGDLAYQHALLEAGHMSENVLLVGSALGLGVRPYAGFEDSRIAALLDLREDYEQSVHSITLSKHYAAGGDTPVQGTLSRLP